MIEVKIAANITYGGATYNTPLFVEYEHTGVQYFKGKNHFTESKEIAEDWIKQGKRVKVKSGYYFIKRFAIPTINASGQPDKWYINNEGDNYRINKVSKYGRKLHEQLSNNINPL
jgi:hypothetical protein